MQIIPIDKGATDVTVPIRIKRSDTGQGLTGLVYNTASLAAHYWRPGAAGETAITLATLATLDAAHADGGFLQIDATNSPGQYRLDLPDAVFAAGANFAILSIKGAANMLDTDILFLLMDVISTSAPIPADVRQFNGGTSELTKLLLAAAQIVSGTAITGTLSTTQMTTNLTEATNDHYAERVVIWTSGNLLNQARRITAYNGTTKMLTYEAATEAPANNDTFIIV